MDLQEAGRKVAKWRDLAADGDKWRAPENVVMKCYIGRSANW